MKARDSVKDFEIYQEIQQLKADVKQFGNPSVDNVLPGHLAWWHDRNNNRHTLVRIARYTGNAVFHDVVIVLCRKATVLTVPLSEINFHGFPPEYAPDQEKKLYRALLRSKWIDPLPRRARKRKGI